MRRIHITSALPLLVVMSLVGVTASAAAQETETPPPEPEELRLLTPYLGVAVEPGGTASLNLELQAPQGDEVALEVVDLPEGWTATIRGGGFVVDRVIVDPALLLNLKLEVDVPPTAPEGEQTVSVRASSATGADQLDFTLMVMAEVAGGVTLSTEFPGLRGPSDTTFTFTLELTNDTGEEIQFGLQGEGPNGWTVTPRPAGQSLASSVTVAAGESERVTVDVEPPIFAPAGVYVLTVSAAGSGQSATAELIVEITGNFALSLVTADERLNVEVEAGRSTELPLVVVNDGTAPLVGVTLAATPPQGWRVAFTPETVDRIEPGGAAEVTATVTASEDAITGDYRLSFQARVPETSDAIEVRATVETSAIWGLVGVGVIVLALVVLGVVFRRFGRR